MAQRLLPCPSCSRHVRLAEAACPFCAHSVQFDHIPPAVSVAQTARLSRTARVALGAALAATVPACGGSATPPDSPQPAPTTTAPPDDDGAPAAEYGAPMPPDDPGAIAPMYGEPAPPPDDDGAGAPEYGAPPEH